MANTVVQPPVADVSAITDPVYQFKSDNGFFAAEFAQTIGTDDAVKFTTNGYSFAWKPDNVIYVDAEGNMDVVFGVNQQSTAQVYKNRVTYVGTSQITSDIFDCNNNELKHTVRMVAPPRIPAGYMGTPIQMASGGTITYDSTLQVFADGQVQTTDFEVTGDIGFKDANGNLIYKLPMITAEDANGQTTQGTYKVTFNTDGTISFYGMVPWNWLQSAAYPVVIDPTVIASNSYNFTYNGRKGVRLSDGSIVVVAHTSTAVQLFKSSDGGTTFTSLYTKSLNTTSIYGASIANDSNDHLWVPYCFYNSSTSPYWSGLGYFVVDKNGTVVDNGSVIHEVANSPASVSFQYPAIAINKNNDVMIACSTNYVGTSPLNAHFGIYSYKKLSTDSAFGGQTQVVYDGTQDTLYCDLVSFSNGYFGCATVSNYSVGSAYWNGSAWQSVSSTALFNPGTSYAQQYVTSCVDTSDKWTVFWTGRNTGSGTSGQFRAMSNSSTNYGQTWNGMFDVSNATSNTANQINRLSATIDTSNNIYLFVSQVDPAVTAGYLQIRRCAFQSGAWGSWTTITNNTTQSADFPFAFFQQSFMNADSTDRYVYIDNQSAQLKYDSYTSNRPPNAPTLTTHGNFDATTAQTLAWTFSDPDSGNIQSAYRLQIVDVATGSTVVDTGKVASVNSTYSLAENTLTNGKQYQWRVMTWDNSGASGPYSSYGTFNTAAAPTVTITAPTANQVLPRSSETVTFSFSDPGNNAQQSYQVQLYDSTGNTKIEDSGVIQGTNNQYTLETALANNTTYIVKVTATNSQNISSTTVSQTFSTSFTPPAAATTTATANNANARITVSIVNPAPSGSQPAVAYNDLHRRKTGTTTWTRIATQLPSGTSDAPTLYEDYATASNQGYDYKVTTVGNNQTSIDSAVAANESVVLPGGMWLHDVSDPSGTILKLPYFEQSGGSGGQTPNTEQWTPTATEMQFSGRKNPVVEFGEAETFQVTKGYVTIVQDEETWNSLTTLLYNQTTLCLRDTRGRMVFGNAVSGYQETDLLFGRQVTIQITQTDYSLVV